MGASFGLHQVASEADQHAERVNAKIAEETVSPYVSGVLRDRSLGPGIGTESVITVLMSAPITDEAFIEFRDHVNKWHPGSK